VPSSSMSSQAGQFGPNEWLVEEMYQRFLDDPTAVDPAWHDFFADYRPEDGDTSPAATEGNGAQATVATEQPAPRKPVAEKAPAEKPATTKSVTAKSTPAVKEQTANGRANGTAKAAAPARFAPEKPAAGSA
jgi:multifunctional 2-oxoglutarate metabolism enzyme